MKNGLRVGLALCFAAAALACGRGADEDAEEIGQLVGDVLSSFDEASQGGAFAALERPMRPTDSLFAPSWGDRIWSAVLPEAHAAACATVTFGACSGGQRKKDFGDCSFGTATLKGSVTLNFSDIVDCTMNDVNESITRVADFTLTGRRGATITVNSNGGGQKVTRTLAGYTYQVLGMQRVGATANDKKLFDVSTKTLQDIVVTGRSRSDRVMSGGQLEVTHNLRDFITLLEPKDLAWTPTCNCPTSGQVSGAFSGAIIGSFNMTMTGCGTATVTVNDDSRDVTLDRCAGS